jgi:hypothetical protein
MNISPAPTTATDSPEKEDLAATGLLDEVVRLTANGLQPGEFFQGFLHKVLAALPALAGALWLRTPEGHLQARAQLNLQQLSLEQGPAGRRLRQELIRQAFQLGRVLPRRPSDWSKGAHRELTTVEEALFVPILLQRQVVGLIELWRPSESENASSPWPIALLERLAQAVSSYLSGLLPQERQAARALWVRLEKYAQEVHASLDPTEVAYIVANEGRELIECDRLSVGVRQGKRMAVTAISGADVIDHRGNAVRLMRELLERVVAWNERLVYTGVRDESLPAPVLQALDAHLAESPARLLAVLPLRSIHGESGRPASVLLLESFESVAAVEPLLARLEVVGRHAGNALANASAYRSIPMRFLWRPIARVQEGLGGKARSLLMAAVAAVSVLILVLCFVSYPLKLSADGQLLPQERHWIYSPVEGQIVRFEEGVQPGSAVRENQSLVLLYDVRLEMTIVGLSNEISVAQQAIEALSRQESGAASESDRLRFGAERRQKELLRDRKLRELSALKERTGADESKPGTFWLRAPCAGTVLNSGFRETLTHRSIRPSEPLLRIGDKTKHWEIEVNIPQKHIARMIEAFETSGQDSELDVDLMLLSCPTRVFRGKLARNRLAAEAGPNREESLSSGSVLVGSVRLDGADIAEADRIPPDLLLSGTEVRAKIRCGDRPAGYCLFYGLWEFLNEKILFLF